MNIEYFIARKVAGSGQQSFSRLIIRIAILGIALSMVVMITATSLIRGFKSEITSKIFGFWGHIHIMDINANRSFEEIPVDVNQDFYPSLDTMEQVRYFEEATFGGVDLGDVMATKNTKGGIRHIQIFATKEGVIISDEVTEGIILKGVWEDFDWEFFDNYLEEGRILEFPDTTASSDILISRQTANRLNLKLEDKFLIYFVKNKKQLGRRFKVCGIYKTGLEEYDKRFALVDLRKIQALHDWKQEQVTGFEVFIDDLDDLNIINEYIYAERLPQTMSSETIRHKFPSIFEWLELQNINERVIIILMILVSIINMVTTLMILILERTNMIGTLKALGQSNWSIQKIFLFYAAYIIGIGLFWGNLIGIVLCLAQKHFGFIKLSESDYYLSVAPIELNFFIILLLNIGTLVVTLLFLIIPSYLVTSITPVKAIRFK